ncbi:MAG: polysaccharide deacetylase family protein, partial [Phycisphaerae bacterium]
MQPHGIMFHHFHDDRHPAGQGSLSADDLAALIRFLEPGRFLPAREWLRRAVAGTLDNQHLCLTFDDNLRCQYDVALRVLGDFGLTAFWFLPTSALQGRLQRLELYRAFRVRYFDEIDDFYEAFFRTLATSNYA